LFLSDPPGLSARMRRRMLDGLAQLNGRQAQAFADPEIRTRIAQYEMAFRMQTSVPELVDVSREPAGVVEMYGPDVKKPGTFAYNCLLARRMAERGVRFIQLYHRGWDQHNNLPRRIREQCQDTDQPSAALVKDLKQRGLLEDTLVVWGGEFGRTPMNEARNGSTFLGRDHNPQCFTIWLAGGGVKRGLVHGETDDFGYTVARDKLSVRDLQATMLHLMGLDAHQLSYAYLGLRQRLIGPTDEAQIAQSILA